MICVIGPFCPPRVAESWSTVANNRRLFCSQPMLKTVWIVLPSWLAEMVGAERTGGWERQYFAAVHRDAGTRHELTALGRTSQRGVAALRLRRMAYRHGDHGQVQLDRCVLHQEHRGDECAEDHDEQQELVASCGLLLRHWLCSLYMALQVKKMPNECANKTPLKNSYLRACRACSRLRNAPG